MVDTDDSLPDEDNTSSLFQEPDGYYAPPKPATFTKYRSNKGLDIELRMVGHNPLWGHLLWNAGQVVSQYLEDNVSLIQGRDVLELGAGAGLPSLVAAVLGARKVVVTDYPDPELIDNLRYNIEHCPALPSKHNIVAEAYLWGHPVDTLIASLDQDTDAFDVLILADILFNHSEHEKLVLTLQLAMKKSSKSCALVFFTPYRPWLLDKDLQFFNLAKNAGFEVVKIFEHTMDKVMFENDPGDETLRRTVFAYELTWLTDTY